MIRRASARLSASPFRARQAASGRATAALLVALLLALGLAARLGFGLLDLAAPQAVAPAIADTAMAASTPVDLSALQRLQLFSAEAPAVALADPAVTASAVPALPSSLDLRLEGVMLAASAGGSRAVIASGTQQRSYKVGEALAGSSAVTLQAVARDHVIIDNRGTREVLALRSAAAAPAVTSAATPAPAAAAGTPPWSPADGMPDFATASAALSELMQLSPAQANGQLIGLRLEPGQRLKEFVQLGFRSGDVVTAVNDVPMDDFSRLPELYGLLQGSAAVSFSLLRDGQPLRLDISLPVPVAAN